MGKSPFIAQPWSLSPAEMIEADRIGDLRQSESGRLGYEDKYGANGGEYLHQLGARGEAVFAKATGLVWHKSVNKPRDPDVGDFGVRTRTQHDYDLLVRAADVPSRPYALVTGTGPYFIVWGWILGRDAMQGRWRKEYGDRHPAYFVPHEALRSINEIQVPFPSRHWSDAWLDDPEAKWNECRARLLGKVPAARKPQAFANVCGG